jgi:hypothetical protein
LEVLFKVARAGGDAAALAAAAKGSPCLEMHLQAASDPFMHWGLPSPAEEAAQLLVELLAADEKARKVFRSSPNPMRRAFALVAEVGAPKALLADLQVLMDEKDPRVLSFASALAECERTPGEPLTEVGSALAQRFAHKLADCHGPGPEADELRDQIASGDLKPGGWSRGAAFQLTFASTDGKQAAEVSPRCALVVYDALAARGRYASHLLGPLLTDAPATLPERKGAAERAARDLARFPEEEQNELSASLVNAGFPSPRAVKISDHPAPQELEAAVRNGHPDATKVIWREYLCHDAVFANERVALLGFVKTREAIEAAAAVAQNCPEAISGGTVALLRAHDPRAIPLLEKALEGSRVHVDVEAAVLESWSPALADELKRIANSRSQASDTAQSLLDSKKK